MASLVLTVGFMVLAMWIVIKLTPDLDNVKGRVPYRIVFTSCLWAITRSIFEALRF